MTHAGRSFLGLFLIFAGLLFLIDNIGLVDLDWLLRQWWPILLVFVGAWLIIRRRKSGRTRASGMVPAHSQVFGDVVMKFSEPHFAGTSISNVFGDVDVDLRSASLAEGEHEITITGVFGDVEVLLPPGACVRVSADTLFGEVTVADHHREGIGSRVMHESPDYGVAQKKLGIRVTVVFGDISVQ